MWILGVRAYTFALASAKFNYLADLIGPGLPVSPLRHIGLLNREGIGS